VGPSAATCPRRPPRPADGFTRGEDSIFYDRSRNRWAGTITVGGKPDGRRDRIRHLVELLGSVKLAELKARDVDFALGKLAKRLSTRSVRLARMILIQAIRNAMSP
jgi:hypothetical protein